MEKLLEQEALMEQQDAKVRHARPLAEVWPARQGGPGGCQAGAEGLVLQDPAPSHGAWTLGTWMCVHSLLCWAQTGVKRRAPLWSIATL